MANQEPKEPKLRISQAAVVTELTGKADEIRRLVPGFEMPLKGQHAAISSKASTKDKFLETAAVVAQKFPWLNSVARLDPDEVREAIAFSAAFEKLADDIAALERGIRHTIAVRRAKVAEAALQLYESAKTAARNKDQADLLPYLDDMKENFGRATTKKRPAKKGQKEAE